MYLNSAVKDAAETDAVLENPVDLKNGGVGLVGGTVRHIVDVENNLRHPPPPSTKP